MNRTVLAIVVCIVVAMGVVCVALLLLSNHAHARAGAEPWPGGLGPLTEAPKRFPATATNEAAQGFAALASPLGESQELSDYVIGQATRAGGTIELDPAVNELLMRQVVTLDALRNHLLTAGDLVWDHDPEHGFEKHEPPLTDHANVARFLVARALGRAHAGDPDAWEELRAASRLAASLQRRPELKSQGFAVMISRLITATAWKLPPPAPPWLEELHRIEAEQLLGRAAQYEAWVVWAHAQRHVVREGAWILWPFARVVGAHYANVQRTTIAPLLGAPGCAFDWRGVVHGRVKQTAPWNVAAQTAALRVGTSWGAVYRYRAEREATINALRIAAGQPLLPASRCADAAWKAEPQAGNMTRLSFSGKVQEDDDEFPIPLDRITSARTTPRST